MVMNGGTIDYTVSLASLGLGELRGGSSVLVVGPAQELTQFAASLNAAPPADDEALAEAVHELVSSTSGCSFALIGLPGMARVEPDASAPQRRPAAVPAEMPLFAGF
jgi:hypothetical protein